MIASQRAPVLLIAALVAAAPSAAALERPESSSAEQNYVLFCGGCHGVAGNGVPHRIPALNLTIGRFLRAGGGRELLLRFPGVANSQLSDAALADVMNLCVARFGGVDRPVDFRPYTVAEVHAARQSPLLNIHVSRAELMRGLGLPADEAADY